MVHAAAVQARCERTRESLVGVPSGRVELSGATDSLTSEV